MCRKAQISAWHCIDEIGRKLQEMGKLWEDQLELYIYIIFTESGFPLVLSLVFSQAMRLTANLCV